MGPMRSIAARQPRGFELGIRREQEAGLTRSRFKFGDAFGADGENGATQFLDAAAKPL